MDFMYLGILGFLLVLAIFDLSVGVANDAVNFLSPAVGARAAKFKIVLLVASIGIFIGASTSSGMMDTKRHLTACSLQFCRRNVRLFGSQCHRCHPT